MQLRASLAPAHLLGSLCVERATAMPRHAPKGEHALCALSHSLAVSAALLLASGERIRDGRSRTSNDGSTARAASVLSVLTTAVAMVRSAAPHMWSGGARERTLAPPLLAARTWHTRLGGTLGGRFGQVLLKTPEVVQLCRP